MEGERPTRTTRVYVTGLIEEILQKTGFTERELAGRIPTTQPTLHHWRTGINSAPVSVLPLLRQLAGEANATEPVDAVSLLLLNDTVAAGPASNLFVRADDGKDPEIGKIAVPRSELRPGHEYRVIRLTGTSMEPTLRKGALLLVNFSRVDPKKLVKKIVVAWLDGEGATVKRLYDDGTHWRLHPDNPECADRQIPKNDKAFQVAAVEKAWVTVE